MNYLDYKLLKRSNNEDGWTDIYAGNEEDVAEASERVIGSTFWLAVKT